MFLNCVLLLALCSLIICSVEGAKILAIFNYPSKSHHILGKSLLKALALRGHQVTMISPYPSLHPLKNYEDIALTGISDYKNEKVAQGITHMQELSLFQRVGKMRENIHKIDEMFLRHSATKQLLASNQTFDLVIQNWFFNSATLGIGDHFKAPVIALSSFGSSVLLNRITGNSGPYAYVPNIFLTLPYEMSFLQRVVNTIGTLAFEFLEYQDTELHERHLREYFPNAPPLEQLLDNVTIVLINSHFSIESPRPYVPGMVQIGGFHIEEPKNLTGDLRDYVDGAAEGILYFSFGTNVKASALPKDKIAGIIQSFSKLPLKVLWKFDDDNLKNLPANVKISKWFPQRDILAHPNTKVFVTHGGLLSTIEAVYHGVPVVGIPFFADQEYNIADSVSKGYAVAVTYEELSEESLTKAVNEILDNPKYRENIQLRSNALRDQPMTPMDTAIFWVEYVLRHKGAPSLKSSALKLRWYQYFLIDVFMFLAAIVALFVCVVCLILRTLLNAFKKLFANNRVQNTKSRRSKKPKVA